MILVYLGGPNLITQVLKNTKLFPVVVRERGNVAGLEDASLIPFS